MTKADIVNKIAHQTRSEKTAVKNIVEAFMGTVKNSLIEGENVFFRGFGTFMLKQRAEKKGRNINKNTTVIIPEHQIPYFKPSKEFVEKVKKANSIK